MKTFPTFYKVAEVLHSNKFYSVIAQNAESKDDVTHLQLLIDGKKRWFPISQLRPTL